MPIKSFFLKNFLFTSALTILLPLSIHAYEFPINSCPATDDLFTHISSQVDDRIEGVTANDTSKKLFTTRGNLTSPWVKNPNVWTNNEEPIDFTGMSPWNSRGGYTRAGTLITPRHIALANHYLLSVGDTVLFVADDNTTVTRTVSAVQRVLSTDISIAKLSSDVPETITHYPIIDSATFEAYLADGFDIVNNLPMVTFDQEDKALVRDISKNTLVSSQGIGHSLSPTGNRGAFNETLIGGDSGNAGFVLIGDKPVLLITHYFADVGPSYSNYRQDIQNVINSMGGEYQLSTIDLSCFNSLIVLEDYTTFSLLENSEAGTSIGTIEVKSNLEDDTPYFSIFSGNDDGAFMINSATGEITVANQLQIQSQNFPRTVGVAVEANGPGGRMSQRGYNVIIATQPFFNINEYSFEVAEHSSNGTVVGDINAFDIQNDTLEYSIISGNENGIFSINSSTGVITVANSTLLDYETGTSHQLTVRTQEINTVQELFADIEVTVTVNDISYAFSQTSYVFQIDESDANGISVGSVGVDIVDTTDINSTFLKIVQQSNSGVFSINSSTGEIIIADGSMLDGNQIYNVVVGVSETSDSSVLKTVPVTVSVSSDNRPTVSFLEIENMSEPYLIKEGESINMIVELSSPYSRTIIADLVHIFGSATPGEDYVLSLNQVVFLPEETSKVFEFQALNDNIFESNQTARIEIIDNTRVTVGLKKNMTFVIEDVLVRRSGGGGGGSRSSSAETQTTESTLSTPEPLTIPTTLPTTIEGLTVLLSQLQAQLAQLLSGAPSQVLLNTLFTRDLENNTEGEDVRQLQQLLISKGYTVSAGATGYFGEQTRQALIKYQQDNNIQPASGYFGPVTRAKISQ